MYTTGATHTLSLLRMSGNKADTAGGALCINACNSISTLTNSVLSGNRAGQQGGAMDLSNTSALTLENCTLAGDSAANGNGIYCDASSPLVENSIVWEGALNSFYTVNNSFPTVMYSLLEGGFAGTRNSSGPPGFAAPQPPTAAPTAAGDYSLTTCSKAIDSGQNTGSYAGVLDFAGNPRLAGNAVDMGAYEFPLEQVTGVISGPARVCEGQQATFTSSVSGGTWSVSPSANASVNATTGVVTGLSPGTVFIRYTVVSNGCPVMIQDTAAVLQFYYQQPTISVNSGAPVCEGVMYPTYGASNFTSNGTWAIGDTNLAVITSASGNMGSFFSKAAGTTPLYYTILDFNGCPSTDTYALTINPLPVVAITGGNTVCLYDSLHLSSTPPGGAWGMTLISSVMGVTRAGSVVAYNLGSDWITYTVTDAQGCVGKDSVLVSVNPLPVIPPILGPGIVCYSQSATYTNATPGGTWSVVATQNPFGFDTGSITPAGVYTAGPAWGQVTDNIFYTYTDPATGCANYTSLAVVTGGPKSRQISDVFCDTGTLVFNGRLITAAGVYIDTFQTYYGCDSIVSMTYTRVGPDTGVIRSGNDLTAAEANGTYAWFRCNANGTRTAIGYNGRTFTARLNGSYCVEVTNSACSLRSACYPVVVTGVSSISAGRLELYPNPTNGSATLQTGSVVAKNILVRDITGKLLLEIKPTGAETVLDTKGFAPGVYLVTVADSEGNVATLRLTIAR